MFHRLGVPSYFGGLPGGYDYVNNQIAGTPAFADGQKSAGPNVGTYFVAFGEDATSSDMNRPAKALAQNTDFLDDLLHRDIALPVRTTDAVGAPTSSILITGPGVFMGLVGALLTDLFHVTNTTDEDIDVSGTKIIVSSAVDSGGVLVGGGFSLGNVTITFNLAIPAAQGFHVYYAQRTNFATFPADGLTTTRVRNLTEVDYQVEELFRLLHGNGEAWNAAWDSTIYDLNQGVLALQTRATADEVLITANTNRFLVDALETFVEPGDGAGFIPSPGTTDFAIASWSVEKRIFTHNVTQILASSDGGYSWPAEITGAGGTVFMGIASGQQSALAIFNLAGVGRFEVAGPSNLSWAIDTPTATGTPSLTAVRDDPFRLDTYWVVGGANPGTNAPVLWKVVTVNGVTPVTQTVVTTTGGGGIANARLVAPGRSTILIAQLDSGTNYLYTCPPGSPTTAAFQTPPTTLPVVDIFWLDAFSWFLLVASNLNSSIEFWTSPTGLTGSWTNRPATALATTYSAHLRGGVVGGSLIGDPTAKGIVVLPLQVNGGSPTQSLAYSYDGGVTWEILPDPLQRHQSLTPKPVLTKLGIVNNRLISSGFQTGNNVVYHALSARTGTP